MTSFVPPTAPTLQRADTNKTMHPPGAWTDDAPNSGAYDDAGESPIAAVGNTLSSAFTAAGSMAASYLPASVVGQIANYAPAMVPQSTKGLDEVKNSDPPAPDIHKPNDRSLNTFSDSKPLESSPNKPLDASLDKPFESPLNKPLDTSLNKASPNDISQPTQFASPSAVSPLSPEKLPGTTNTGSGDPFSPLSTVATLGHAYGTDAPPPSAATNSAVPSRDTSIPFSPGIGSSTDSEAGYKSIATKYASPTSTGQVGSGPTHSGTNSSVPSRDTSLPFSTSSGIGGSMSSSGAGYKPFDEKEHHVPSSTISMKSGHIGSGPTHTGTGDSITGNLPPIASPVADGITPGASELEKDDLHYLAPAIASRDKVVPTTAAASKPLIETSKFAEDLSAHPTPASAHSSANSPVSAGGHSRNASGASSVSVGGSPKRKVTLANRIKGEAKILSGKLTKDTAKVQQGRDILSGEV